jgi:hypothetical protein
LVLLPIAWAAINALCACSIMQVSVVLNLYYYYYYYYWSPGLVWRSEELAAHSVKNEVGNPT